MKYFILEPEVAGDLGEGTEMNRGVHPPEVTTLHYKFDGWLGDVLVESFPCFVATVDAAKRLQEIQATGIEIADVRVTKSSQFQEIFPNKVLKDFKWLKVTGKAGEQDFGLASDFRLVVSERVLSVLKMLGLWNALTEDFEP